MQISTYRDWTVRNLLDRRAAQPENRLPVNHEYQRGDREWSRAQQRMFIDSVLRRYPVPAFYLHDPTDGEQVRQASRRPFWVVDGQQRLAAMMLFREDKLRLADAPSARGYPGSLAVPYFPSEIECTWGGRTYSRLSAEDRQRFEDTEVVVHVVQTRDECIVRDLFIRLQGGSTLTAQQCRDAYPGAFPEYVKRTGGCPDYPVGNNYGAGHRLFTDFAYGSGDAMRQLAAQLWLLVAELTAEVPRLPPIRSRDLDHLYACNVDFDPEGSVTRRYEELLDLLVGALASAPRRPGKYRRVFLVDVVVALLDLLADPEVAQGLQGRRQELGEAMYRFAEDVASERVRGFAFKEQGHARHVLAYREESGSLDVGAVRARSRSLAADLRGVLGLDLDREEQARRVDVPSEDDLESEAEEPII